MARHVPCRTSANQPGCLVRIRSPRFTLALALLPFTAISMITKSASAQKGSPLCRTGCTGDYSVSVIPQASSMQALAGINTTVTFWVTNTGIVFDTYTLSCLVLGSETCVNVSPSSVSLDPNE